MCLFVTKSRVRKPIQEVECFKTLMYAGSGKWVTPYRRAAVPKGTGWFAPLAPARRRVREYRSNEAVNGGYIHAFTRNIHEKTYDTLPTRPKVGRTYSFKAVARDVVAYGDWRDIACRALYIPAFDLTGAHRNAVLDVM